MRLLVVSQHYKPEPFNVSETCEELVRRGHEVIVLTALPNYPEGRVREEYRHGAHRDEVVNGVRVIRVPIIARGESLRGLNKVRRIANYISFPFTAWATRAAMDIQYDCAICFQFSPILMALPALRIAKKQGIPCLMWSFDLWPEDMLTGGLSRNGFPYRIMRRISQRIYGKADEVAVTSPGFINYFSEQLDLVKLKTTWLPQFAEKMFENNAASRESGNEIVFTFAGNIGNNQSVETIVRAASLLKSEPIRIRIAGSGSMLESCQLLAFDLSASNVEFLGRLPVEDMPSLYATSDAMLLTLSKPRDRSLVSVCTIPRKFQSYLASGKPVICAADGIVSDLVVAEGCGVACPAEDAEALADAMRSFASAGAEKRLSFSSKAKDLYAERFSRRFFFDRLDCVLNGLVGAESE